jgi:HlyD family secretion protein
MTDQPATGQTPAGNSPAEVPATAAATALTQPASSAVSQPRSTALSTNVRPPKSPTPAVENPNAWSSRRPIWTGIITVVLLIAFFGGWGMLTTISGAVVAPGLIQVEQNRQVVQHPDGGVVAEINVAEAQSVKAGDLLIRLDGTQVKAELAIVEGQLFDSMARKARLEAERDDLASVTFPADLTALGATRPDVAEQIEGQKRLFTARLETQTAQISQLQKRLDQISAQDVGITAQMASIDDQIALLQPEINDQQTLLDKGLTQSARIMDLKREVARLDGNKGEMQSNLAQAEGKATETQLQILQIKSARREDANNQLRDMGDKTLELAERRRALSEQVNRLDIRAPVSGIVLGLAVTTPHSVIRPADPILYIIPQDRPLIIIVQIPPIHVDEVRVGQEVHVSFAAFSARTTPQLNGKLTTISADAISDPASHQSFYRAEITLDAGELAKLGTDKLVPGMPVQAFISTGERTPMAYLMKPFTDYFKVAMREN